MVKDFQKEIFEDYMTNQSIGKKSISRKRFKAAEGIYATNFDKYLPKNKDIKILEIGCGRGIFINYIKNRGFRKVEGVDISKEQIAFCKKNIWPRVKCEDGYSYLKKSKTVYDMIVMHQVIEHIPKDELLPFLKLIHAKLKNNGIFYLTTPNMNNFCILKGRYTDFTHEVGFTTNSIEEVLKASGFNKVITENFKFSKYSIKGIVWRVPQMMAFLFIWALYAAQGLWLPRVMTKSINVIAFKSKAT